MASDSDRPNMVDLGVGVYLVRTQAGYRKAFKHFIGKRKASGTELEGQFPSQYPNLVHFRWGYGGYFYVISKVCGDLAARLEPFLEELQGPKRPAPTAPPKG